MIVIFWTIRTIVTLYYCSIMLYYQDDCTHSEVCAIHVYFDISQIQDIVIIYLLPHSDFCCDHHPLSTLCMIHLGSSQTHSFPLCQFPNDQGNTHVQLLWYLYQFSAWLIIISNAIHLIRLKIEGMLFTFNS